MNPREAIEAAELTEHETANRNQLARQITNGVSHAELEQRRWGPGGRAHFADPRPGDFAGRENKPEPQTEAELEAEAR